MANLFLLFAYNLVWSFDLYQCKLFTVCLLPCYLMQNFFIICTKGLLLNTTECYRCLGYVASPLIPLMKTLHRHRYLNSNSWSHLENCCLIFFVCLVVVFWFGFLPLSGCEKERTRNISKYTHLSRSFPTWAVPWTFWDKHTLNCFISCIRQLVINVTKYYN